MKKKSIQVVEKPKQTTWIDSILDVTEVIEAPKSFIFWSTLFCIAVASKRQIKLPQGFWNLYPNLYVMLMAESGLGKDFPVYLAKNLITKGVATRIISGGQNSIQGIIRSIGKAISLPSGKMIKNSEAAFMSSDFVNFVIKDPLAFTTIMELYDCADNWEKILTNERFALKNVYVNWLAVSNQELFTSKMEDYELKGGFLGRMLMIKEDEIDHLNSLTSPPPPLDYDTLAKRLTEIENLKGDFVYGSHAAERYDSWYYAFYGNKDRVRDKARFDNRLRGHVLKVAMNLSLSYKDELELLEQDIDTAIVLCQPLLETVISLTEEMGQSRYKGLNSIVTNTLIQAKDNRILRSRLIDMHKGEWNMREFNDTISLLESADTVEVKTINNNVYVCLSDNAMEQLRKVREKREKTKKG